MPRFPFAPVRPLLAVLAFAAAPLRAEGPFRNRDNQSPNDPAEGTYPVPYQLPAAAEIAADLARVRDFLDRATPTRVVHRATGAEITDRATPVAEAGPALAAERFSLLAYEMGVVHAGLLAAAEATGDAKFTALTARHLGFLGEWLPYFRAQAAQFGVDRSPVRGLLEPRALDDCGSMCAALIRARLAHVGPDLKPVIDTWSAYVAKGQFRLADGTLARQRPQAQSLWADDAYMGIAPLAQMGRLTGDRAWFDDAVNNALGMLSRLHNPRNGLLTHGWNSANPAAPRFHWARANGWMVVALSDLLDVLPPDHPGREKILAHFTSLLRALAELQSGAGLWHQMLDRNDSYLETSASAMFTYAIAHAVNQGWVSPVTWGSVAQAGWVGVSTRINPQGGVEGTCVGTTFASDQIYYYNRPVSPTALHGYGPVLLAGAEMIRLLKNPAFEIQVKLRTYHYVPQSGGPTSYREHQ